MAIQSSGAISLSDLQTEFGGSNPISLSEYYQNADPDLVTANNTGVPNTGNAIDLSDFYGATKQFTYTFTSDAEEVDLNTVVTAAGWNGSDPISVVVNSDVTISSDDTSVAALTISSAFNSLLTITNNGKIHGRGGNGGTGAGADGGDAIANSATGVTLTNASGAFIAGGGGAGGGGLDSNLQSWAGGGGAGGGAGAASQVGSSGSGGTVLQLGNNSYGEPFMYGGAGKNSGGEDGNGNPGNGGFNGGGAGAAGGGGAGYGNAAGGAGGEINSSGNAGSGGQAGGGGGGWGASGASGSGFSASYGGGAGGAAISGTAINTYTNNGTVYGSVA